MPFCPYYADVVSLDDNDPLQRARGIENDMAILTRPGMVDELRLYGERISDGMRDEGITAYNMGIPIVCASQKLYSEYLSIIAVFAPKKRCKRMKMHQKERYKLKSEHANIL